MEIDVKRIRNVSDLLTKSSKLRFKKHVSARKFLQKISDRIDSENLKTAVADVTGSELVKLATISDPRKKYENKLWRKIELKKRNGKIREVFIVDKRLALVHEAIKPVIDELPVSDYSYAYVRKRGAIDAAWRVAKSNPSFIWRGDLMNFFPTITDDKIAHSLIDIGWGKSVAWTVAQLSTLNGRMEQGSKVAPTLSNVVAKKLYDDLAALSKSNGLGFMAYSDDMYFYGQLEKGPEQELWDILKYKIDEIVKRHGFRLHYEKWIRRRTGLKVLSAFIKNGYVVPDGKMEGLCRAMILEKLKPEGKPHYNGEAISDRSIASRLSWIWQINKQQFMKRFGNYVTKLRRWYPEHIDEKIRDLFPVEFREEYFIKKEDDNPESVESLLEGMGT